MLTLSFPAPAFRIKSEKGKEMIFDAQRRRWVVLTPEEWVRQNMLQYLLQVLHYPAALVALEKEIKAGELRKRFDLLVYDSEHRPWMMVECKAMEVELCEKTLHQLLRYHLAVPVRFLVITNGRQCYIWRKFEGQLLPLDRFPDFSRES